MEKFPFLSLRIYAVALRVVTAGIFLAHAVVRLLNGTIPNFAEALRQKGFPLPVLIVWGITAFEVIGGTLLAIGWWTRYAALGFLGILLAGIAIIHYRLGWFVGEHGTGGCEYSVCLIFGLLVISAADAEGLFSKKPSRL